MQQLKWWLVLAAIAAGASPRAEAQQPAAAPASAPAPAPAPGDVASEDAIIGALYDVISGAAGAPRDWDRMRSLFHPEARLIPAGRAPDGSYRIRVLTLKDWIANAEPYFAREGFFERELAHRSERFGQVVHRFSTYDSRHAASDTTAFARGINSIQLFNDGRRWWVMNIMWDAERPGLTIPEEYLRSR
jgi:hypothetical protein